MSKICKSVAEVITNLIARKFYGKLTISFEKGKIVTWNVSENFKP